MRNSGISSRFNNCKGCTTEPSIKTLGLYGAFTLPDTDTDTKTDTITTVPNGNLCWCLSEQYEHLYTIPYNPLFIGLGVFGSVGQSERTITTINIQNFQFHNTVFVLDFFCPPRMSCSGSVHTQRKRLQKLPAILPYAINVTPKLRKPNHIWRAAVHGDHYVTGIIPGAGTDWGFM